MKFTITMIILMLFMTTPALGETINPVNNFLIIEDFPGNITSGSQDQIVYNFSLTHNINVAMNFSVSHPDINYSEWNVYYILNNETIVPNETGPGVFSNETTMAIGDYELITIFESLPNIVPGIYEFKSWLTYDGIEVASVVKKSGGRRRYPTPTPTPTPVNATPVSIPVLVDESNETSMHIDVPEPPQEPYSNYTIYGILGIIAVVLLAYAYSKRNKSE